MREILFRGKCIDGDKMVYGDLLQYRVYPVIFDKDKEQHEVDASTVGQYTGIKDKKGNKIFEGDIVTDYGFFFESGVVSQVDNKWTPTWEEEGEERLSNDKDWWAHCEVIGNRFDNPELLNNK